MLFQGRVVLPDGIIEEGQVVVRDGRIAEVRRRRRASRNPTTIDAGSGWIVPGFIDIHVHGGHGADYMDGTADAVRTVNRAHLRCGTTTIFPTTTTGSPAQVRRMLDACLEVRRNWSAADGARIGGVHLYGPYFAEKKVGCHSVEGRRDPQAKEYEEYFRLGIVKIATCAAELPGHMRPLQRDLERDGARLPGRSAPRGSFLVRDEFGGFAARTIWHADAGEHGGVRTGAPRDEYGGHCGRRASRERTTEVCVPDERSFTTVSGDGCQSRDGNAAGPLPVWPHRGWRDVRKQRQGGLRAGVRARELGSRAGYDVAQHGCVERRAAARRSANGEPHTCGASRYRRRSGKH